MNDEKPTQAEINAFCQAAGEKRDDALISRMLLKYGNAMIHQGHMPGGDPVLGYAANWGHADLVEFFIERGADVNRVGDCGWTPLMEAAWHTGNPETVAVLLKHGADPEAVDHRGNTASMIAAKEKSDAEAICGQGDRDIEWLQRCSKQVKTLSASITLIDAAAHARREGRKAHKAMAQGAANPIALLKKIRLKP